MNRLFVYGTLRPASSHEWAGRLRAASDYEGPATVTGSLYRIAHYPGLVEEPDSGIVHGDLLSLRQFDSMIAALDEYEGPDYRRAVRSVQTADGQTVQAWVYLFEASIHGKPRIASGDWLSLIE